jgi:hypothetical protein
MKKICSYFVPLLLVFLLVIPTQSADVFKAGAAVRIITPDPLLPVSGGIGTPNPVTMKKGDLFARALVLEKGETRVAIVSIDNLGWPATLGDKSRALIKSIPPENILIGVTHTHSAPDAYGFPDKEGNSIADLAYLDWCVQQIAEAVNEAAKNLQSANLKITVDELNGQIAWNAYAEALFDPRCGVVQAISNSGPQKGETIATLVNYAIHPEVIGSERGILTPDLCGPFYDRIEANGGGIGIFMNGAQGGMVTADNRRENGQEETTWEECIRIGNLFADEALRIIEGAPLQENPTLYCAAKTIQFPIESKMMRFILEKSPLKANVDENFNISTTLNLINVGTAQMLTIPGEALPNIGSYVKRNMNTNQAFLLGMTNDAFGYIIAKVDFYAFDRYNYISKTSLGENTGEILMQESIDFIKKSPAPDGH